jgi:hypothetical protein
MVEVELTDAARDDLLQLREHRRARHGAPLSGEFAELEDDATLLAVQRGAISALVELRDNPWQGQRTAPAPAVGTSSTAATSTSIATAIGAVTQGTNASGSSTDSSPMRAPPQRRPSLPSPSGRANLDTDLPNAAGRARINRLARRRGPKRHPVSCRFPLRRASRALGCPAANGRGDRRSTPTALAQG